MFGPGSLIFGSNTPNPSGGAGITLTTLGTSGVSTLVAGVLNIPNYTFTPTVVSASEGIFLNGTDVEWGTGLGGSGVPFSFPHLVDMANFAMHFRTGNPFFVYEALPFNAAGMSQDLYRAEFTGFGPAMPYQARMVATPTAGGVFDLQYFQGFNIDSAFSGAQPSWTDRWEYAFQGSFYERHIQWESADHSRVNRLFSITFQDHGGVGDAATVFIENTLAVNRLNGGSTFWAVAEGSNFAHMSMFEGTLNLELQVFDDGVNPLVNMFMNTGVCSMQWQQFTDYRLQTSAGPTFLVTHTGTHPMIGPLDVSKNLYVDATALGIIAQGDISELLFTGANTATIVFDTGIGEIRHTVPAGGYSMKFFPNNTLGLTLDTSQNALVANQIQTGDPGSGTALWRIGGVVVGAVALDATSYVETLINGVIVKLLKAA